VEGLNDYGHAEYTIHCNCCRVSHNSRISIYDTRRRHVDGLQDVSGAEVETMCIDLKESHLTRAYIYGYLK